MCNDFKLMYEYDDGEYFHVTMMSDEEIKEFCLSMDDGMKW